MRKIKMLLVLGICLVFGANAFAAGNHHNAYHKQYNNHKNVKVVKNTNHKKQPHKKVVKKTVVVHHNERPRHNHSAETAVLVGLGIITTAAIINAVL